MRLAIEELYYLQLHVSVQKISEGLESHFLNRGGLFSRNTDFQPELTTHPA